MRFDKTLGKEAWYMVSIHMPDGCNDFLYYHYYKDAKDKFKWLCECGHYERETSFSLWDIRKDERKNYVRI